MPGDRRKILVLTSHGAMARGEMVESLRATSDVVEADNIDHAIELLRTENFDAVFAGAGDFLPLERALVSQQASLILNTVGEGVCIVDSHGRCNWMNKRMAQFPAAVHERIRRTCQDAYETFARQPPMIGPEGFPLPRSRRYSMNIEDQQFMDMICSPVTRPDGQVVQIVAVVWDATSTRRLQGRMDAIDRAGRELVRLEGEAMAKLPPPERLQFLEQKIISYTRELMHFDHFAIRLLNRKTNKLEYVMGCGLPPEATAIELYGRSEGNGISGHVAATGISYICPDVERDSRYVQGLDSARSSLTVPLFLADNKVVGIFNIESRQRAAFTEDDRQFAEIFGRYIAVALNILDLMVTERVSTSHTVSDIVCAESAGPLNDIASEVTGMMEDFITQDALRKRLQSVLDNVNLIRRSLKQVAAGPNLVIGASDVKENDDPLITDMRILVADDEANIRETISDVLRKYHAQVTTAANGGEAIAAIEIGHFDLVISDISMPDKTGYDVFAAARKRSSTLPVILMTGFGYDPGHSIVRASQEGLQAVLFKPFKVAQFLSEVRKALQVAPTAR